MDLFKLEIIKNADDLNVVFNLQKKYLTFIVEKYASYYKKEYHRGKLNSEPLFFDNTKIFQQVIILMQSYIDKFCSSFDFSLKLLFDLLFNLELNTKYREVQLNIETYIEEQVEEFLIKNIDTKKNIDMYYTNNLWEVKDVV